MVGNVFEWTEDCWNSYDGAPTDGSAWPDSDCDNRDVRGGSYNYSPDYLRSARRMRNEHHDRALYVGFRVARTLKR